eukprot:TRINITY_DN37_c0_g2_i15.p1 TRINITY_DN37_c0_g2~~TRINITY_DN37_c0_g2_i15.p1  ORF type:complete len:158 (-),score=17.29 TRINITY_DN37_c0_g2_i15:23-496(-)
MNDYVHEEEFNDYHVMLLQQGSYDQQDIEYDVTNDDAPGGHVFFRNAPGSYDILLPRDVKAKHARRREDGFGMHLGYVLLGAIVSFMQLYYSYVLRGGVFCNLNVARWMEFVVFSDDVDIDNDIQNDDMVHVKCVLALSCQANVNTQKPSLKVRQYT